MRIPDRIPLILDVDTGIDDSLALLYACASREAQVVAVTCVGGNVDARQVAENTRAVLELAGRADVEVALGRERPLARPLETTPETHGPKGIGYAVLPPASRPLSRRHAADLMIEEARCRPGELTLVTLGPLTNVAIAVLREPELPRLLRRLWIMGGAYRSPGNTAPTTEWNMHVDPEAARVVFEAFAGEGIPRPVAMGLDVTERAKLTPDHLARLAQRAGSEPPGSTVPGIGERQSPQAGGPVAAGPVGANPQAAGPVAAGPVATNPVVRFVQDALRFYMEFHSRYDGFYGAFVHDPFVVAAALDPTLVRTEALAVEIELGGRLTTGETVTDWRRSWGRPPNVDVGVWADADGFFERFVERVGGLAAQRGATTD